MNVESNTHIMKSFVGWLEVDIEQVCIAGDRRWRYDSLLVIAIHRWALVSSVSALLIFIRLLW